MKVLLCDDEKGVITALSLLLQAIGHEVVEFTDPTAALKASQEEEGLDIFVCDLRMPELDGLEVLAQLRLIKPYLPFVLMSAHAQDDEIQQAEALGANGFLAKPFTPDQFEAVVAAAMEKGR